VSIAPFSAPNAPFVDSDGRLTYAANVFLRQVLERIGGANSWGIVDLMQTPDAPTGADVDAIAKGLESEQLASEVAELRALVAELSKTDIETQIAQLREQVAYMGGMKRKRVVAGSIALASTETVKTFTISPAVASLDLCDLRFLGSTTTAASVLADAHVGIELTNTTTITARRGSLNSTATVYFQLTEYTQ